MENTPQKYKPLLFSTDMVIANLQGRKTMTRRTKGLEIVNVRPDDWELDGLQLNGNFIFHNKHNKDEAWIVPPMKEGDIIWVRETWQYFDVKEEWSEENEMYDHFIGYTYKASNDCRPDGITVEEYCGNWVKTTEEQYWNASDKIEEEEIEGKDVWYPSIHMPKTAARLFLRILKVKCERLNSISEKDAIAEGIEKLDSNAIFSNKDVYKNYLGETTGKYLSAFSSFSTLWKSINGKESWQLNPWVFAYEYEIIEKPENWPS